MSLENEGAAPGSSGNGSSNKVVALGSATVTTPTPSSGVEQAAPFEFHPLANLFPLMEGAEFDELVADIKVNGQRDGIVLYEEKILDGRNRYRACRKAGVEPRYADWPGGDPHAFVISRNLHRRHLTGEQRRELIAKLLKATPEKSDRQIAATLKASHHTVGAVRAEMEGRGQIAHVEKRTDTKGRKQPSPVVYLLKKEKERKRSSAAATDRKELSKKDLDRVDAVLKDASSKKELERKVAQLDRDNNQKLFDLVRLKDQIKQLKTHNAAVDGHNNQLLGDLRESQAEQRRLQDRLADLTTASATPAVDQTAPPPVAPPDVQERILEDVALNRVIFDISALAQKHGKQPAYSFLFITLRAELDRIESNERPDEGGTA